MVMGWFDRLTMTFVILSLSKDGARGGDCMVMLSCFHEDRGLSFRSFSAPIVIGTSEAMNCSLSYVRNNSLNPLKDNPLSSF